ncbi:lytic transglycosylase domain-containing protein (plasmid) [Novosphingobium sp. ES2-1]|nr:lytic transglycosylase domain-containing protein [Novosphingobium sp. ES2-1]
MHFAKLLSITLTILGINSQSIARDVERLQFEIPANSERGGPSLLGLTEFAHPNRVTQPLLEQFQFASGRDTFAESRLNGPMPSNFGCDAASYQPTWWLPRAAEARRASYHRILKDIACQHGLPARLLDALIAQESGFASGSVSKAGAMGMMQIMPGTARSLGLSNPFDPISNMHAGARYLRQQIDRFGRIDLALAAYNAGPERRSLRQGRIPAIPETQHYVRTILTNWDRLIDLDRANEREPNRGELAMLAVRASGYRGVELIRYDGSNASNPM